MNKEVKKIMMIKIVQLLIYGISIIGAVLNRGSSSNWPTYLVLIGILIGNFIPIKYRSNYNSTAPGIILKNHTRRLETVIEITATCIVIFLIFILDML